MYIRARKGKGSSAPENFY